MLLAFDAYRWFAVFAWLYGLFVAGIDDVESVLMGYAVEACLLEARITWFVVET